MKKIFNANQIKQIDNCTIESQDISSIDLMERASLAVYDLLVQKLSPVQPIYIFVGRGNNGGDGLALARMLMCNDFYLQVYLVDVGTGLSPNCLQNKKRLEHLTRINIIKEEKDIPVMSSDTIVIDSLFGVGVNRPVAGLDKAVIAKINESDCNKVYSIDMPSGLFVEDNLNNDPEAIIKADEVYTFQFPKLSLLLPDSRLYCARMTIVDIGLNEKCMTDMETDFSFLEKQNISNLLKTRNLFANKGNFGRAYIVAGMYGKMGAAVMSAKACLRTGVGLLTMHVPQCGVNVLQSIVPEAMVDPDKNEVQVSEINIDLDKYTLGIGPGLGVGEYTLHLLANILKSYKKPVVIDADALNIIAANEYLKKLIPPKSILTPHPLEYERLAGCKFQTAYQRLLSAKEFAIHYDVFLVLKGAYTAIITPEGKVCFNSTGNPGMATGGSGDVLTGIITSLLAQGYSPQNSALFGVYMHGYAGDLAAKSKSQQGMIASDIIDYIPKVYKMLQKK